MSAPPSAEVERLQHEEEELRRRLQELMRSNVDLAHFAHVAAHDLQEPLRKVITFGDRLKEVSAGKLDPEGAECVERMCSAALRMRVLIDSLLSYARAITAVQPLEPVSLSAAARDAAGDLEPRSAACGARVEIGELPTVQADPVQLRQLFQNLIGNALKFRRSDASPTVRVVERPAPKGFVAFAVEDDGIGFDPKYAQKIFEPFHRLHGRGQYEGAGMGLAICDRIALRHGGEIRAEGSLGHGARFTVTLPAAPAR
jgi:light-regulated signal transduction histidine kinase (bacteriophytochrome)